MNQSDEAQWSVGKLLSVMIAVVVAIYLGGLALAWHLFLGLEERGQFGDLFGSVNALFSGLAFAGLICTLILQKRELALQRTEIAATRDVLRDQSVAQGRQVEAQLRAAEIAGLAALLQVDSKIQADSKTRIGSMLAASSAEHFRKRLESLLNQAGGDEG